MKLLLSIVGLVAGNPTKVDLKFTFFSLQGGFTDVTENFIF